MRRTEIILQLLTKSGVKNTLQRFNYLTSLTDNQLLKELNHEKQ